MGHDGTDRRSIYDLNLLRGQWFHHSQRRRSGTEQQQHCVVVCVRATFLRGVISSLTMQSRSRQPVVFVRKTKGILCIRNGVRSHYWIYSLLVIDTHTDAMLKLVFFLSLFYSFLPRFPFLCVLLHN